MREYKVGEYYNFLVKGLNSKRIFLEDEDGRKFNVYAYKFQVDWDWSSPQVPESVLRCYIKEIDSLGRVCLEQSRDVLLALLYPEASRMEETVSRFSVVQLKTISGRLFYIVEDAYGMTHMYKPSNENVLLQPGDEVELNVKAINFKDRNKSHLILVEIGGKDNVADNTANNAAESENREGEAVGPFGEENEKVEFKTTIVYPAGATGPDIDTQMRVILQTLAGFMNAKGGTLYIGVNDNGDAVGIESEYCMLNSSLKDKYRYQQNNDGYENKIRSSITRSLGQVAQDYVSIEFFEHTGHTICKIQCEPSNSVVWLNEYNAFKRLGRSTIHLHSDAIVKLVLDKTNYKRPSSIYVKPTAVSSEEDLLPSDVLVDTERDIEPIVMKVGRPSLIMNIGEERKGKGSFYMNLFTNGDWSWSKEKPGDDDLQFCIPINSPASNNDLIIVYADGCVNRVDAYHLHLDKKENKRYQNGRRNDGVEIVKVFHAKAEDLLACFSTQHGHDFVKVHNVSHVSQHDIMSLKGNRLINTKGMSGITRADIFFVASEHDQRVSALKKTENQMSNSLGIQTDLKKNSKFIHVINTLKTLCDIDGKMN